MKANESKNGASKWEKQLANSLKREHENPERLYERLDRLKQSRPATNDLNENHMKHKQAAQELNGNKKTSAADLIQKKLNKSEHGSPLRQDSYSSKPQVTQFKFTRTNSKSSVASPLRNELKPVDEFENVEETMKIYMAPDGKMSVFWTIPITHILQKQSKRIEFHSIAFPAKAYNNKKWNLSLVIIKSFERSVFSDRVEIYLNAIKNEEELIDPYWRRQPTVILSISQKKGELIYERNFTENFDEENPKWGIGMEKNKIDMMLKTSITIGCTLKPGKTLRKADAKYVGLVNAGNTCYMNSFLQTLYHLPSLTRLVFQVPFSDEMSVSIPTALQRLFYDLKTSYTAVRTTELTRSFGWDTRQTWIQQDVQEFCCLLLDALDAKTKGIKGVEHEINKLFEGKLINYIKCINVNYESRREETFKEIQLQVKGLTNIYESLDSYVQEEILDEDNLYDTVQYGKQPARKGVKFSKLPPVLMIQLKRFEYDHELERNIKICDAYEYFPQIDLSKYMETPPVTPLKYQLFSVLVHSGTGSASGHYYAYLRPEKGGEWYKFNDEYVDVAQLDEVYDANFGGSYTDAKLDRITKNVDVKKVMSNVTAYMLVYINENLIDRILKPLTDDDIPQAFTNELGKQKKAEEDKSSQRTTKDNMIKIYLTSFDLLEDINTPGLTHYRLGGHDDENVEKFTKDKSKRYKLRMSKSSKIPDLLETITELSGIPKNEYHLFKISARDEKLSQITRHDRLNGNYSLGTLINGTSTAIQGNLRNVVLILPINRKKHPKIFEKESGVGTDKSNWLKFQRYDSNLNSPKDEKMLIESNSMDIETDRISLYDEILNENYKLIFLKIYFNEYHQGRIRMLDYLFMKNLASLSTLLPYLEKKHPEIPWEDAKVYQELKRKYELEEVDKRGYFESLDVGDIILIDVGVSQSSPPYLPAVDYYEELNNQVNVKFLGSKTGLTQKALLPKSMILTDIAKYISKEYFSGIVDPEKILLKAKYKNAQHYSQIGSNELKDGKPLTLGDLTRFEENIVYEESQVPVSDLDKLLRIMVAYYSVCTNDCSVEEEIYIDKQATVKDLLEKITVDKHFEEQIEQDQCDLADESPNTLIVTLHEKNGKINMKCAEDLELKHLVKKGSLRVQLWEAEVSQNYIEAFCYHCTKDSVVFGTAFLTKFKRYFDNRGIRTHLTNQMNEWELEYNDKKIKMTPEYMPKLKFNFIYERLRESPKTIKIEENSESHIERLDLPKDTKIQIEIVHPITSSAGYTAMKIA